jgi:hypothetical protein
VIDPDLSCTVPLLLPLSPNRHFRTFHEDLAAVAVLLAPLGRDGMMPLNRGVGRNARARSPYSFAPLRALGLPYGKPLRSWEAEVRRVVEFTGLRCVP